MAKVLVPTDFDAKTIEELGRFVTISINQMAQEINGHISFVQNTDSVIKTITFPGSGINMPVQHNLNRIASGYFLVGASTPMSLYDGVGRNTTDTIILRSTAAGSARILVF